MTTSSPIPLVDLAIQHAEIAEEVERGWAEVVATGAFVRGPQVAAFEAELAAHLGVAYGVGVANGTDAVELALRGLGIGPSDEVIVVANTFVATAEAVERIGATVRLVDCDDATLLLDPEALAARGINLEDVRTVLGQANVDLAKGTLNSPRQTYTLNTNDQLLQADDYANLILAYRNGAPVRVRDVGRAISAPEND